ncbi:MAG TPA: S9 family peptidase, partial [Terriglobia bacterium]|nr:S9 family peptidase [Terriglobia bacterium]
DRKLQQVVKEDLEISSMAWSPDSSELALRVASTPRLDDVYWQSKLVIIQRATGRIVRTISQNAADSPEVRWSPDGQTIVFGEYTPARIAEWLALDPVSGGPARYLLKDYAGTIRRVEWESDSKHLVAESNEGTKDRFLRIDTNSGTADKLPVETALPHADFTLSKDGRTIAYLRGTADSPENVWVFSLSQAPRRLTDMNTQVATWRLGDVKEISWKSRKDGEPIYGVLATPPDFKSGQPYPTIVEVHGGPESAWWSGWLGSWRDWAQLLASHGYIILMPNPRGSTGQSWKFTEANRDDWGGGDYQDIMDGLDSLIALKIADPNRLGVGGWSYGGFMTSWMVTQSSHFAAAVVGAGVTDLFSFDGTTDITPSFLRAYFLDLPFRRRADYDKHSPMTFLQNCKTPTLVLHGAADERVPISQGWEFYNGLRMLGVPSEMVIYPREHHGLKERAHQIDLLKRVLAWYDKYLRN